ncbi:MAG: hypothetical protein AAFV95_25830 [Bacteroidota bacterium]
MYKSKLLQLLRKLSPEEFKELRKAVQSPIYKPGPQLIRLYDYLRPCYPGFTAPKLDRQKAFRRLFPDKEFSDLQMRVLMREMCRVVEEFLIMLQIRADPLQRKRLLSEAYGQRGLVEQFKKTSTQLLNDWEALPYRDPEYHLHNFQLQHLQLNLLDVSQKADKLRRTAVLRMHLQEFFEQSDLIFQCQLLNLASIYNPAKQSEQGLPKTSLLRSLYQHIYKLYNAHDDQDYFHLKELFFDNLGQVRPMQAKEVFTFLSNYLIKKMSDNDAFYNQLLFALYKQGLSHDILMAQDRVTDHQFLNILIVAAKEKAFQWAEQFIDTSKDQLSDNSREDVLRLGRAYLLFYQRKFEQSIDQLAAHLFGHPLYQINAQSHMLKCHFEIFMGDNSYYHLLVDKSLAFGRQIRRSDFLSTQKSNRYLHFNQMIRKMARMRMEKKRDRHQKLQKEVAKGKAMHSMKWIIDKMGQL